MPERFEHKPSPRESSRELAEHLIKPADVVDTSPVKEALRASETERVQEHLPPVQERTDVTNQSQRIREIIQENIGDYFAKFKKEEKDRVRSEGLAMINRLHVILNSNEPNQKKMYRELWEWYGNFRDVNDKNFEYWREKEAANKTGEILSLLDPV